jgi:hypothetical protein
METLTLEPRTKRDIEAVKAFANALKIPIKKNGSPYNPEFIAKIKRGDEDIKAGRYREISLEELEKMCK